MGNVIIKQRYSISLINENPTKYYYRVVYFDSWDNVTSKEFLIRLDIEVDNGYPVWIQPYHINENGDQEERKEMVIKPSANSNYYLKGDDYEVKD